MALGRSRFQDLEFLSGFCLFRAPQAQAAASPGSCSLGQGTECVSLWSKTTSRCRRSANVHSRFCRQLTTPATPREGQSRPSVLASLVHPSVERCEPERSWQQQVPETRRQGQDQSPRGHRLKAGFPTHSGTSDWRMLSLSHRHGDGARPQQSRASSSLPLRRRTPAAHPASQPTSQPTLLRSVWIRTRLSMIGPCASLPTLDGWMDWMRASNPPARLSAE